MKSKIKKSWASMLCSMVLALCMVLSCFVQPVQASENPSEVMLGIFWTSEENQTDTLYVSFDGKNFKKIGEAYTDAFPDSSEDNRITESPSLSPRADRIGEETWHVNALHDPGLIYKEDGEFTGFWSLSGFTTVKDGEKRFVPMLGYSKDLVNWSFPNSGSEENVRVSKLPYGKDGQRNNTDWDAVAPDFMVDDDGTVWIVVSMGYYAQWHGDSSLNDVMSPYLIKVTGLKPGSTDLATGDSNGRDNKGKQPVVSYSEAMPIELGDTSTDRIDGSLYKENGKYYLSIKENGVTNEIWQIDDLNNCQDSSKWTKVTDVVTGYEGPCLTKYAGSYYFYTDKLADYPHDNPDWTTGTYLCRAENINGPWTAPEKISTVDSMGNEIANRHGTVLTVTNPNAIAVVMECYYAAGYTYDPDRDKPSELQLNGWFYRDNNKYWYENGVLQGTEGRGKEIYDPGTDAWYWLDAIDGGKMAVNKDVYQESWAGPYADREDGTGKWVRYDENGRMVKGEDFKDNNWYRFDLVTGAMVKGWYTADDGKKFYYDKNTGVMLHGEAEIDGIPCYFHVHEGYGIDGWYEIDGVPYWYEGGVRQGTEGRGKEIYDPGTDAWYWLDAVDDGKKAVSKDVYQESWAGPYADREDGTGKWVRYNENGHMIKGWDLKDGNYYYFDPITGAMAKGTAVIDGVTCYFNISTGILEYKE